MRPAKRIFIYSIIGIICALFGSYTSLDWFQYIRGIADYARPELPYVRAAKVAVSLLAAVLAFMTGKDGFDRGDTRRLVMVYGVIFIGDIFLVFDLALVGTGVFALSHVFFMVRNGAGLRAYMARPSRVNRALDAASALALCAVAACAMRFLFYPLMGGQFMLYVLMGYSLFLGASLWTAWASLRIGFMPRGNAALTAVGLTCFFVSDFLVGVHFATPPGELQTLSIYLCWIFYTPALVLPALSGYARAK